MFFKFIQVSNITKHIRHTVSSQDQTIRRELIMWRAQLSVFDQRGPTQSVSNQLLFDL